MIHKSSLNVRSDEFKANARGWRTIAFEDLPFRHHRREGERDGTAWRARANQGAAAYYLGYRAWYLVLRALWNARREPAALGMIWGFASSVARRAERSADAAARAYLRRQQSPRNLRRRPTCRTMSWPRMTPPFSSGPNCGRCACNWSCSSPR